MMDNLPAHKVDSIKPMIEAVGASIELAQNVGCDHPLKNIAFLVVGEVQKKTLQSLN